MNSTTQTQYCTIHQSQHNTDSLLDRIWNRISHSLTTEDIQGNSRLQKKILNQQKELEVQNLARRNNDVARMVVRYVF